MTMTPELTDTAPGLEQARTAQAEKELIDYCNRCLSVAKQARVTFERQWYQNLAFYFGRHWVQWMSSSLDISGIVSDSQYSRLYEPAVPPWRVRLVINKTRAIIRGELAKVIKEHPRGFVVPTSTDEEDIAASRAADAIIDYLFRDRKVAKVTRQAEFWNMLCGSAFIKDWFDPNVPDSSGVKGSIMCEPVSPFHLYAPDLQQEEVESQPFLIHVIAKSPDWIKQTFNKSIGPDSSAMGGVLEQKFLSALGISSTEAARRYVSVKEGWIKPNGKFPQGAQVLWAGGQILGIKEEWPYQHKEYPFSKVDHVPTGRFYGDSSIVDLAPLQREYNRTRSQIVEAKNRMSKPQLMAPRGSIDPKKVTSEPGLIVFYCVDDKTEALTRRGWKRHDELVVGEEILSYSKQKDACEWQPLQSVFSRDDFEGELYALEGKQLSARTTEGHRWVVESRKTGALSEKVSETLTNGYSIPLARPVVNQGYNSIYTEDFIELLGWIISDGSLHSSRCGVQLIQSKYCLKIKALFKRLGISPNENIITSPLSGESASSWYIGGEIGKEVCRLLKNSKKLPYSFVSSLSCNQLWALYTGLLSGDGNLNKRLFCTTREYEADLAQMIGTLLGITTSINVYIRSDKTYECDYEVKFKQYDYGRVANLPGLRKFKEYYKGTVWCPTVENSFWMARRNGRVYVTGNTPGFAPPQPIPLVGIPAYVIDELERIQHDMDDISSQHEITRGNVPPGVTAATAISYLQEQDDSKLAPTVASLEEAVEKLGRHFLNHVAQFWTAERQIQVIGNNGAFDSFMFSRSNIKGNTDFKVEVGSATPTSRAAKQAFIMDLVDKGLIPPDKALRYLNMAETGKLYEEMQLDSRQAQRENLKMAMGEQVPTNSWDNDQIHVTEHDNYRKTQEFETLPDPIKQAFEQHVQGHKMKVAQSQGITLGPQDPRLNSVMDHVASGGDNVPQPASGVPQGANGQAG